MSSQIKACEKLNRVRLHWLCVKRFLTHNKSYLCFISVQFVGLEKNVEYWTFQVVLVKKVIRLGVALRWFRECIVDEEVEALSSYEIGSEFQASAILGLESRPLTWGPCSLASFCVAAHHLHVARAAQNEPSKARP